MSADAILRACAVGVVLLLGACSAKPNLAEQMRRSRAYEALMTKGVLELRKAGLSHEESAEGYFAMADELIPGTARAADAFGCLAFRSGRISEAKRLFAEALRRDPGFARAKAHLALVETLDKNYKQANDLYRRATNEDPLDGRIRQHYAEFLSKIGQKDDGARERAKAKAVLELPKR